MGNSYIKWQVGESDSLQSGVLSYEELEANPEFFASFFQSQCVIASVVGRSALEGKPLEGFKNVNWLLEPHENSSLFHHCYARSERLGVDRWLNMIGARAMQSKPQPVLVVSAGTALTLDVFDLNNQHQGGLIVPGIDGAKRFLFSKTCNVNDYSDEQNETQVSLDLGCSTTQCVISGAHRMSVAIVQSVLNDYPDCELFVTGGNGAWLADKLDVSYYPNLIFSGMSILCAGYLSL